jgi:hypothetical protein
MATPFRGGDPAARRFRLFADIFSPLPGPLVDASFQELAAFRSVNHADLPASGTHVIFGSAEG